MFSAVSEIGPRKPPHSTHPSIWGAPANDIVVSLDSLI